jgi:hypothetical protein
MIGTLRSIVIDTTDVAALSAFYGELAGFSAAAFAFQDDWVTTKATPAGPRLAFQRIGEHVAPRWPDPAYPQQMHLDFLTADLEATVEAAEKLGATRLPGGGETYTVLADPSSHPFCVVQREGVSGVPLADVAIDCPDGAALARFYAELLDLEVTYEGAEGAMLAADGELSVMFQNVPAYTAPRWPDPAYPQQLHLDVEIEEEIDRAERRVLALGAMRLPGGGDNFRVYADPVGHPFCLVW